MDSQRIVERGTILRATVGSTVHGLHHEAGTIAMRAYRRAWRW